MSAWWSPWRLRTERIAFAASQHVVDRIKQTVPIWKKEFFEGGEVWVESPEDVALRERQAVANAGNAD